MTIETMIKKQDYQTLIKATLACLNEIKERSVHYESALNDLDYPQMGSMEELIAFEETDEFQEALRIDSNNDVFELEIDAVIANLQDQVED